MTKKRRLALLIVVLFALSMIFSASFIVRSSGHSCSADACAVCLRVEVCLNVLNNVGSAVLLLCVSSAAVLCIFASCCILRRFSVGATLVKLKIKLSD